LFPPSASLRRQEQCCHLVPFWDSRPFTSLCPFLIPPYRNAVSPVFPTAFFLARHNGQRRSLFTSSPPPTPMFSTPPFFLDPPNHTPLHHPQSPLHVLFPFLIPLFFFFPGAPPPPPPLFFQKTFSELHFPLEMPWFPQPSKPASPYFTPSRSPPLSNLRPTPPSTFRIFPLFGPAPPLDPRPGPVQPLNFLLCLVFHPSPNWPPFVSLPLSFFFFLPFFEKIPGANDFPFSVSLFQSISTLTPTPALLILIGFSPEKMHFPPTFPRGP